jgi:zinc transport system ATP-binding protein
MKRLDIADLWSKPFASLSGGQRQRVLLSRALCATGGVLLLDEPLASLDPIAAAGFFEVLDNLKKQNYTVIMISHDIHCAIKYADKILHLAGEDTFFGTSHDYAHSSVGHKMLEEGHHHND